MSDATDATIDIAEITLAARHLLAGKASAIAYQRDPNRVIWIATEAGCPNFGEVFMFYGSHGLHGGTDKQREWLMLDEGDHYDLAHFDAICREAAAIQGMRPVWVLKAL